MKLAEFIRKEGIRVILKDFPTAVKGFCYHDHDGRCYIAINSRLSKEQQKKTIKHELDHIRNGELFDPDYVEYD